MNNNSKLIFVAISDGILNNDAFKHIAGETNNETWTELLVDLKFFDDIEDHTKHLRRRFVLGAADWMAGKNGSLQDDKLLFDYTDDEWEYVWMTMLEDGAWNVSSIKDGEGNLVKPNYGPEILIKFIAHDLRCHIIVFDLHHDRIQFVSGNHLKSNNVVFDSPLLVYATGNHFQSVMQVNHEFFINYAKELEAENKDINLPMEQNENIDDQASLIEIENTKSSRTITNNEINNTADAKKSKKPMSSTSQGLRKSTRIAKNLPHKQNITPRKEKMPKATKRQLESTDDVELRNRFSSLSSLESECNNDFETFEVIRNIKKKRSDQRATIII